MGQTTQKPLRTRDFCWFSMRNCGLHLEHIVVFKIIARNRTLLCTSVQILKIQKLNIQILQFLKVKNKM